MTKDLHVKWHPASRKSLQLQVLPSPLFVPYYHIPTSHLILDRLRIIQTDPHVLMEHVGHLGLVIPASRPLDGGRRAHLAHLVIAEKAVLSRVGTPERLLFSGVAHLVPVDVDEFEGAAVEGDSQDEFGRVGAQLQVGAQSGVLWKPAPASVEDYADTQSQLLNTQLFCRSLLCSSQRERLQHNFTRLHLF